MKVNEMYGFLIKASKFELKLKITCLLLLGLIWLEISHTKILFQLANKKVQFQIIPLF